MARDVIDLYGLNYAHSIANFHVSSSFAARSPIDILYFRFTIFA
jgi:hypothetical protein